jgi:TrkA domain protein
VKNSGEHIDIISRALPGIGICQELELRSGRRIGIVTRRDGLVDLVIYDAEDPDAAHDQVELSDDESNAIAEILGAPQLVVQLATLQQQVSGLLVEQLPVPAHSPFAGGTLGDTQTRTRTGASIVAVIRQGAVTPSPGPEFGLRADDLVVVVGTKEAIDQVAAILDGMASDSLSG